jgi:hypothetical protein
MDWAASPYVIPVAAFVMVLGIIIVSNIANYHTRKLKSEERMAAIAKGIPLPPEPEIELNPTTLGYVNRELTPEERAYRSRGLRTGGIVLTSVGVGVSIFGLVLTWIVQEHDVLVVAAAGVIPLAIGIGLLIDYALRSRTGLSS